MAGKIEIRRAKNKEFYGVLFSPNGKVTWKTPETYKRRAGVHNAIRSMKDTARGARVVDCT